jgi:fucose 4-O-acetylase-like acetyltransferase
MRDQQLDIYRSLAIIYIVCVIHVLYWYNIGTGLVRSVFLFEMPVIFFIAGAAQSVNKHQHTLQTIIISRSKRVLIPYYIFLAVLFIILLLITYIHPIIGDYHIYIWSLGWKEIFKILCTGGCDSIPSYGYTWFISCYLIICCSLPLQVKLMKKLHKYVYLIGLCLVFFIFNFIHFSHGELEIKNILIYNIFFLIGYLFYKNINMKYIIFIIIFTTPYIVYGFMNNTLIPMQNHKFPADTYFLIFGICAICWLSVIFKCVHIRNNKLLNIWNERCFTIYIYQTISYLIVYAITLRWIHAVTSETLQFIILFTMTFTIATLLSFITYPLEKFVTKHIFKHKKDYRQ